MTDSPTDEPRLLVRQVELPPGSDDGLDLSEVLASRLDVDREDVLSARLLKRSVDARSRPPVVRANIEARVRAGRRLLDRHRGDPNLVEAPPPKQAPVGHVRIQGRPIVVGAGPAGLFCALALAEKGHAPLLVERGRSVRPRWKDVRRYWRDGTLDAESNVAFGEGGAGTFSDGKVYTRRNDPRTPFILETLAEAADAPDVLVDARPHLGTNRLSRALFALREKLEAAGVELRFETRLEDVELDDERRVRSVTLSGERCETDAVFLACGHSARDVQDLLVARGVTLEARPFAVGARIEHRQELINEAMHGQAEVSEELGAATYSFAWSRRGLSAHSFCTCPGGEVVAASTEEGALTVNGMSYSHRLQPFCNTAVVVEVPPEDLPGEGPLVGVEFQRRLERRAAELGGGAQRAPAQGVPDFLAGRKSREMGPTSFRLGLESVELGELLPERVVASMQGAIRNFARRVPGYDREGQLIAVEARTTSPVRVLRDDATGWSVNTPGLYPVGEGAGFAGGIVSAASDGLRSVERIAERAR
ncbi:MAG: FAD-dependent protein [Acidobacteriota bacterium]